MPTCNHCGSEMDQYDSCGNEGPFCSKMCWVFIELRKTSHCWKFDCPGVVRRTPETKDGPYGNFCPVCNRSLRLHPEYGEGMPLDLKLIRPNY
jgi:hypothetical protein